MYSDRHLFHTFLSFLMVQNDWLINYIPEPIKKMVDHVNRQNYEYF